MLSCIAEGRTRSTPILTDLSRDDYRVMKEAQLFNARERWKHAAGLATSAQRVVNAVSAFRMAGKPDVASRALGSAAPYMV